jgi:DHA3 family macrolide efflux protein-like MFS transporter
MSSMGAGYLIGTLVMSIWGGPRRRALGILIPGIIQGVVMIGFGISPSLAVIAGSIFIFSALDPIVGGSSQGLWQSTVPADIQGRVFVVRWMISRIGLASSLMLAGPLAEKVFEPLFLSNGILAGSLGKIIGTGAGRGTGLQLIVLGVLFCLSSIMALCYTPLRLVDTRLPEV